jgi:hypothetical protein
MTGLRERRLDPRLPAAAGDVALVPPDPEEIGALVEEYLLAEDGPLVVAVSLEYARWKPRTSVTCLYDVQLADGVGLTLGLKRYASDKARQLAGKLAGQRTASSRPGHARELALLPEESLLLWLFPRDRVLAGIEPSLDPRWFARTVEAAGLLPERSVRRRRLRTCVLRYKPERRCVVRFDLHLRPGGALRHVVARFHPPGTLEAQLRRRLGFERAVDDGLVPDTLFVDGRRGLVVERWLDVEAAAPCDFEHAPVAGGILARIHRSLPAEGAGGPALRLPSDLPELFAADARLGSLGAELPAPLRDRPITWIHGDVHPDQFARERGDGSWRLLDLDAVGPGDPMRDLASWAADHLHERPGTEVDDAIEALVTGYGPRRHVDFRRLLPRLAEELVLRAAAALRRLEEDAVEVALRDLRLAAELRGRTGR